MAVQLLVEMARDVPNVMLQQSLFQHILFNFKIWSRSQFHIRIGECFEPSVNFSITSDTVANNLPRYAKVISVHMQHIPTVISSLPCSLCCRPCAIHLDRYQG